MFDIKQLDNAYDPAEQIQIALGVHPDQADAQQTTADALAKAGINPSTAARSLDAGSNLKPADDAQAIAPIARPNGARAINMPSPEASASVSGAVPPIASGSTLQSAVAANPMSGNDARLAGHKSELDRLQNSTDHDGNIPTGGASGIAQIQNPFLRGLARVGDIAGKVMFPTIEREIPGTEGHHQALVNEAQGNVASDLGGQSKELALTHQKLENDALDNKPAPTPKPIFDQAGDLIAFQNGDDLLGPNSPKLTPDMKDMMAAAKGKSSPTGTPESQAMADLQKQTNPATNKPYTPYEAFQKINTDKAQEKPDAVDKQEMDDWIAKNKGKGPSDFMAYKAKLVPAFNFNLQQGNGAAATTPKAADGTPLTGDALIKSFGAKGAVVKGIVEGREAMPSSFAMSKPYWQDVMQKVYQADPEFSEQRAQIRKAFTTGPDGRNIGNLNTAVVHLDALGEIAKALDNGSFQPGNALYNKAKTMFGGAVPTDYESLRQAVSGEMDAALHGTSTIPGREAIAATMPAKGAPGQMVGVVDTNMNTLHQKLNTYKERYEQQIPNDKAWSPILPSASKVLEKHGVASGNEDSAQHPEENKYPGFVVDNKK